MEGLVKLVEAVKLVDTSSLQSGSDFPIPDGRIWAEGKGLEIEQGVGLDLCENWCDYWAVISVIR